MGGWMDYARVRNRNGLQFRKPLSDSDPYPRVPGEVAEGKYGLVGDLNRMERDYLQPEKNPALDRQGDSSPLKQAAEATGVDIETVRKVLRHVFWGGNTIGFDPDAS